VAIQNKQTFLELVSKVKDMNKIECKVIYCICNWIHC